MANKRCSDPDKKLTAKQRTFVENYVLTWDAVQAFHTAYPSSKKWTLKQTRSEACKYLRLPHIAAIVEKRRAKFEEIAEKKFEITAEKVLQELAAIAFQNSEDYFTWGAYEKPRYRKDKQSGRYEPVIGPNGEPITDTVPFAQIKPSDQLTRSQKRAILSVSETVTKTGDRLIEPKMADKLGALKLLGQHLALFKEKIEHTHEHTVVENAARDLDSRLAEVFARTAEIGNSQRTH